MADNSGFRVDKLADIDIRTGAKVDHLFTFLGHPWVAIWMSPRETIRKIVTRDPTHQVVMLGAIAGSLAALNFFLGAALGFTPTPPPPALIPYLPILTLLSPFLGAALGLVGLYLGAFVINWTGRALGGVGNAAAVRAAVAWSQVPQICLSITMLLILLGAGLWQAFVPSLPDPNVTSSATDLAKQFTPARGVEAIISIWSFILMLHCVGEVHRFSAWRALGAVVLPVVVLLLVVVAAGLSMS